MSVWTLDQAVALYGEDRQIWLAEEIAPHLRRYEIACRCGCGNAEISTALIYLWTAIRIAWGKPILWTCGCRCSLHNRTVQMRAGQVPNDNSRHVTEVLKGILGRAGDLTPGNRAEVPAFATCCLPFIGDGGFKHYADRYFCHIDTGESSDLKTRRKYRG